MTTALNAAEADRVLKSAHRAMWALGDYAAIASEVIPHLGADLALVIALVDDPGPHQLPQPLRQQ